MYLEHHGVAALGEAGGLCTARRVEMSSGDVILCTRETGHYEPDDLPGFKRGKSDGTPGGWHLAAPSGVMPERPVRRTRPSENCRN
ncbi:hypothetical protein [Streptomyces sp. SID4985]|uniref:hypothetical protein n=1 Tax=Streptomyces sp. SID4985 TaxID=2690292 RepID=UPI00136B02E0|nr:hypothetical protein [Streptomyces sp. SID4985]